MDDILGQSVEDVKQLKASTMQYAKQSLLEAVAPKIKEYIESHLGEGDPKLEVGGADLDELEVTEDLDESPDLTQEARGKKKDEDEEENGEVDESLEFEAKDEEVPELEDEPEEEVEEMVQIEMKDIEEAFARAVKESLAEAKVTKNFGSQQDPNDHDGPGERGLEGKEKDKQWSEVKPPAAKDWTVKEALYRKKIVEMARKLGQYKEAYEEVSKALKEVNLFNTKLMYTTKLLQGGSMSDKQKTRVIEHMDKAQNRREVQLIYQSLSESF